MLTVVIPCKNEQRYIAKTIQALHREQQSFGLIEEIIVVDNGSTDDSVSIAESMGVKVIQSEGTISAVRNIGAREAKAPYLAFIDADVEVKPGWSLHVKEVLSVLGEHALNSLIGYPCNIPDDPTWIEAVWFKSLVGRKTINYIGAANLTVSKQLFDELGGFDESLITGEDVELCARAKRRGKRVVLDPVLDVIHHGYPKNISSFYARERWHGIASQKRGGGVLGSKAGWLALLAIIYLLGFVVAVAIGFVVVALCVTAGLFATALLLCAKRLNDFSSAQPLQLSVLFTVYTVARSHSLLDSLFNCGKAREYSLRKKQYSAGP